MRIKPTLLAMSIFCSTLLLNACSQLPPSAKTVSENTVQKLVAVVTHGQGKVKKVFPGPGGLTAVSVELDGHPNIVYVTPDGKNLILAQAILNEEGKNLIKEDAIEAGLLPKPKPAAQIAKDVSSSAKSFVVGKSGPEIIAFVDPNCIFCHKFYEDAKPLIAEGKLRVRYVVVAFLKPSSLPKAEAILSAKDPAQAMAENEKGFDEETEEGGITALPDANSKVAAAVENNTQLLVDTGEEATPTILYCNRAKQPVLVHGMPGTAADLIQKIGAGFNSAGSCQ